STARNRRRTREAPGFGPRYSAPGRRVRPAQAAQGSPAARDARSVDSPRAFIPMTLPLVIYRSLRQHALSTAITAASIALACGLLMCVWMVKTQSQAAFTQTTTGFDAVLGARGSKLQLVLN